MIISKITSITPLKNNINSNEITPNGYRRDTKQYNDVFVKSASPVSNNTNISFGSINFEEVKVLTRAIARTTNSKKRVIEKYHEHPDAQGITLGGGLPKEWISRIKDISKFDKEAFLERFGELFTIDRHFADIDVLAAGIEKLFKDVGIAQPEDKVNTTYIAKGFFGRGFKIDINGEDAKLTKEFKRTKRFHNNHGNYSEQNLAEYINEYSGHDTNMVRYYFGDTKNGTMTVDYISERSPKPINRIELDEIGLDYNDKKAANYAQDYIIDYGGLITIKNLVGNKTAQEVYRTFKHLEDDAAKLKLFETIAQNPKDEKYRDKMIGLTHSIRFMPEEIQGELYQTMAKSDISHVKVAVIENACNYPKSFNSEQMLRELMTNADKKMKEAAAREIKYFPTKLAHQIFEELSYEPNTKIKKYLARNINYYYMNMPNRIKIFERLLENGDMFSDIALVNSLHWFGETGKKRFFSELFDKKDINVISELARTMDIFDEEPREIEKWTKKFLEVEDPRVQRSMCEVVGDLPIEFRRETFQRLLEVKDMNAKEFLAESFSSLPNFELRIDYLKQLLEGADNAVRRSLAQNIGKIKDPYNRKKWIELISQDADSSVKAIIAQQ